MKWMRDLFGWEPTWMLALYCVAGSSCWGVSWSQFYNWHLPQAGDALLPYHWELSKGQHGPRPTCFNPICITCWCGVWGWFSQISGPGLKRKFCSNCLDSWLGFLIRKCRVLDITGSVGLEVKGYCLIGNGSVAFSTLLESDFVFLTC